MNKIIVTIALGTAAVAPPILAQAPTGFQRHDQTRAEVQQRAVMIFRLADSNHDGVVTRQEAQDAAAQFAGRGGGDGRAAGRVQRTIDEAFGRSQSMTLQQLEDKLLARFDAMDLNHDGVVTSAERQQYRAQRAASRVNAPLAPRGAATATPRSNVPPSPAQ